MFPEHVSESQREEGWCRAEDSQRLRSTIGQRMFELEGEISSPKAPHSSSGLVRRPDLNSDHDRSYTMPFLNGGIQYKVNALEDDGRRTNSCSGRTRTVACPYHNHRGRHPCISGPRLEGRGHLFCMLRVCLPYLERQLSRFHLYYPQKSIGNENSRL